MITYNVNHTKYNVRQWKFPGGEVGVDINVGTMVPSIDQLFIAVNAHLQSSDDVMALLMTTDALRRSWPFAKLALNLAYVPYARQDRVCNPGEALSIKVFADLINSMNYDFVEIADPHSSVTPALLNNCGIIDQFEIFGRVKNFAPCVIVAPDMGAQKKAEDFARRVGAKDVVCFNKTRELSTGKIIGMNCLDSIDHNDHHVVLDDICDGGRTFLELAEYFPDYTKLDLIVTHGIFSKGVDILTEVYDHVYTTDSFRTDLENSDKLTVIRKFA